MIICCGRGWEIFAKYQLCIEQNHGAYDLSLLYQMLGALSP